MQLLLQVGNKNSIQKSSTEAKFVAADDMAGPMVWTQNFFKAQGYHLKANILYQDNHSAILLESNGRRSAGRWSCCHLNIQLFFVMDQKKKGHISIRFCPTDPMIGDYMTKPLYDWKFTQFQQEIINLPITTQLIMWHCIRLLSWSDCVFTWYIFNIHV